MHWETPSRASSSLGAAATTATRAAMGRMVEKRKYIFSMILSDWVGLFEVQWDAFCWWWASLWLGFLYREECLFPHPLHAPAHSPFAQRTCRCEEVGGHLLLSRHRRATRRNQITIYFLKCRNLRMLLLAGHAILVLGPVEHAMSTARETWPH